jgi:Domain of unknown function (DUF5916)/Carbohydrate family 9 binding domain-like
MRKLSLLICFIITLKTSVFSQQTIKKMHAVKTDATFKIDGDLSEAGWKKCPPFTGLIEFRPNPGKVESDQNKTEVYILYDDNNIYIGGYCHEKSVDSISRELVGRDKIGNSDFVGVIFDTYNDKINGSGFFVTPYGEQYDAKYSAFGNEDDTWNAVWESEAKMQKDGWTFEMRIPYSALRFSNKENQTWGLNIIRRRQKTSQQFAWSNIDPNVSGLQNQEGEWTGIEKIKAPLRLSFSPYFSTYLNHYPYKTEGVKDLTSSVNGGMDVKYGINESFTLDMTLIPDFGQVQSDNKVLNLTPFEVKYNENRSFFTEGTELFSKGNLFYSRRIGSQPIHYNDVVNEIDSSEHIIKNPTESKLINATKISGRTSKGLGIGFLNAITNTMYAIVEDTHGKQRKIETNPLTNYNILVLDQSLKNNSSVSLINTNVLRDGNDYNANVSAFVFNINNKKNIYNWNGKIALSNIYNKDGHTQTGYMHNLGFGKVGGRFNVILNQELTDDKYNPNDLGILFNNNYLDHYFYVGYNWNKPGKWYNQLHLNNNFTYSRRYRPDAYQIFNYNGNINGQLKNLMYAGININYNARGNDFYEPRVAGRVYQKPAGAGFGGWVNSNQSKKYYYYLEVDFGFSNLFRNRYYIFNVQNNYRFNDKFSIGHTINLAPSYNQTGFADVSGPDIIFSRRNRTTIENIFNSKYNFNKRNGITFRLRHYWSEVLPKEFFTLQPSGSLVKNVSYNLNSSQNLNIFNIDMVYTWEFAPGSFLNLVWKNSIYSGNQQVDESYFKNFSHTVSAPQNNNISLKVIYYLDAVSFRKKHH